MLRKITDNIIWSVLLAALIIAVVFLVVKFSYLSITIILALVAIVLIFTKIIKNPFWGMLLLIFFLPFERIPTIDVGLVTLKINQLVAGLTLIAWVLSLMFQKRKIEPNPLTWPIIFFLLACFLSILQAGDLTRAIEVFVFTVFVILVGVLVVNLVNSKDKLQQIITMLFTITLIICLFALYQFVGDMIGLSPALTGLKVGYTKIVFGFPRVMAFFNEPLYLADFLFIPLGIGIALFFANINIIKRSYLWFLIVLMLIVFILTVSRGAYLGLVAMALVFLIFMIRKIFAWKHIIVGVMIILSVGAGTLFFLSKAQPRAFEEFIGHVTVQDFSSGESTQGRLQAYSKAIDIWKSHPVLGIGVGNYGPYTKGFPDSKTVTGWDVVNNEYLEIMAETGTVGIIAFALIIIVLFWRGIIAYFLSHDEFLKVILVGLFAAFIAILVQYNFFSTLYIMHIWVLIGLIIAVENLIFREKKI